MSATSPTRLDLVIAAAVFLMIGLIIKAGPVSSYQHEKSYYAGAARAEKDTLSSIPFSARAAGETIARQTNMNCPHLGRLWAVPTGEHKNAAFWATTASKAQVERNGYKKWMSCYDDQIFMLSAGADRNTLNRLRQARGMALLSD